MFLNPQTGKRDTFGCWCFLELMVVSKSNCWAYDQGEDFGWPKELNDFP